MPMIRHQLIAKQVNVVLLQPLAQTTFKRCVIGLVVKDLGARISPVQGMVQPDRLIGSWSSWHSRTTQILLREINESCP